MTGWKNELTVGELSLKYGILLENNSILHGSDVGNKKEKWGKRESLITQRSYTLHLYNTILLSTSLHGYNHYGIPSKCLP